MTSIDQHAEALFDFAVNHHEGFTRDDACNELGISVDTFRSAMRHLRMVLADGTAAIPCSPTSDGSQWTYRIATRRDEIEPWAHNRIHDAETRLATMTALMKPIVSATDGRTKDGRIAREMYLTFRQLKERLEFLQESLS